MASIRKGNRMGRVNSDDAHASIVNTRGTTYALPTPHHTASDMARASLEASARGHDMAGQLHSPQHSPRFQSSEREEHHLGYPHPISSDRGILIGHPPARAPLLARPIPVAKQVDAHLVGLEGRWTHPSTFVSMEDDEVRERKHRQFRGKRYSPLEVEARDDGT